MPFATLAFAAALIATAAAAQPAQPAQPEFAPPPAGLSAREVAAQMEQVFRGNSSYIEAEMRITSPRLPAARIIGFRAWDDKPKRRALIRITAPPKDAGVAFLKLHPNLWNYIPRVERTLRIPPSMMLQSWMGSDFSNDDLVRESSQLDDYEHRWLGVAQNPAHPESKRAYVIEYTPKEYAPVVWGRIVTWIDAARMAPLQSEYYDEAGAKVRLLRYARFAKTGRPFPHHWLMQPLEKPGHQTEVHVHKIRFNENFAAALFTKQALSRRPN